MTFIPYGENILEKKKCAISGTEFFVTDKDLEFYEKISPIFAGQKYLISSPTLCPDERQRRRMSFRNELVLYHRKCDKTGNQIISIYSPDKPFTVYDQKVWWGDEWNGNEYARTFDFSRPFFEQFKELQLQVPRVNLFAKNCENAEYTNHTDHIKNSYISVDVADSENIYYSRWIINSRNCYDCYRLENCELCYQSQYSTNCYSLQYCILCDDCSDCFFCQNIKNCQNCILCYGIQGKKYCIMNKQYSPEEYNLKKSEILTTMSLNPKSIENVFQDFTQNLPHQNLVLRNTENVVGDMIDNSKNVVQSFDVSNGEDIRYCYEVTGIKDSYDVFESGFNCEQQYECYASNRTSFSAFSTIGYDNAYNWYCDLCNNTQNCFGSIGLKKQNHCVLNKNYSTHEYEGLCGKIIDHMRSIGEWGEFFPLRLSPFSYDETVAQELFPLSCEDVISRGGKWRGEEETSSYHGTYYSPLPIDQYDEKNVGYEIAQKNIDTVLSGIIQCQLTKKPFKIIRQELAFYIENRIPLPCKHSGQRHLERLSQRNPREIHERTCAECDKNIITTYIENSPEKVVCEECYRKLIY